MPGQDYWFITTGENGQTGIDGGVMKSPDGATRTTNSIDVPSIDDYLKKIVQNGGNVVVPKTQIPGMGSLADFIFLHGLHS